MWKFLESEMLVIIGLTENANRTDAEIADMYYLKKGTVASVRRRLLDAGAIHYVNVPAFNKLGCEMLACHIGSTEPSVSSDIKANHYMEFCNRAPQIFHALIGGSSLVMYSALRNATEFESLVQTHNKFFTGSKRSSKAKLVSTVFPYSLSKGTYVPSFAPIVHDYFGLDVPAPKPPSPVSASVETPDLTDTEKQTLCALIENSRASDRETAAGVDLSRQAITRIRNKLIDEGYMSTVCIPRLYKWGFEIYAVAHPRFNMEVGWERRLRSQPRQTVDLSFLTLSKPDEAVGNYNLAKFTDYSDHLESVLAWYHKIGAFEEKPEIVLFSLERSTELRAFDYAPAVRNLLFG